MPNKEEPIISAANTLGGVVSGFFNELGVAAMAAIAGLLAVAYRSATKRVPISVCDSRHVALNTVLRDMNASIKELVKGQARIEGYLKGRDQ